MLYLDEQTKNHSVHAAARGLRSARRAAAQIFAVRTNALAVCSATLNVGAEAALTDNWSLELSGYWNRVNPHPSR